MFRCIKSEWCILCRPLHIASTDAGASLKLGTGKYWLLDFYQETQKEHGRWESVLKQVEWWVISLLNPPVTLGSI